MTVEHTTKYQNPKFIINKLSYLDNITKLMRCVHGPNNRFENEDSGC